MAVLLFKERCVKIFEIVLSDFCYEPNDIRGDIDNRRLQQSGIISRHRKMTIERKISGFGNPNYHELN